MTWTTEQILALAPDSSAAAAGRALASPGKWALLGSDARAAWGECKGSGAKPYQVQIDLAEPAFKCSCPSRRFPCKHCLGLFLLWAESAAKPGEPPVWVAEWLDKRSSAAEAKEKKAQESVPRDEASQNRRAVQREARVAAGIEELEIWIRDLVRAGFAAAQMQPSAFWERMAARMVDAQAPGIARRIREMAVTPATGVGWAERLLQQVGRLWLLVEAYRRLKSLPPETQATVRANIGWTLRQEELFSQEGVRGSWLVVGRRVETEDKLQVQRTWLLGAAGAALLLHFAGPGQAFELTLIPGGCLDAEIVYYPGSLRQRATVKLIEGDAARMKSIPCHRDITSYLQAFSRELAADPWLARSLAALTAVTPARVHDRFCVIDSTGLALPISPAFSMVWQLVSIGGSKPLTLFAEWDGSTLLPLSAMADRRFHDLSVEKARST